MSWLALTAIAAFFYATSNAITSMFQKRMPSNVGQVWFSIGALIGAVVILFLTKNISGKTLPQAQFLAILSGLTFSIGFYFFFQVLAKNPPFSLAMPVLVGGIGIGGVIAGVLLFNETISLWQVIGIITVMVGSIIIGRG